MSTPRRHSRGAVGKLRAADLLILAAQAVACVGACVVLHGWMMGTWLG